MEKVSDYLARKRPARFRPTPYYDAEADTLVVHFRPNESYGKRVDSLLTILLSLESDEIVGCQVKGVRERLRRLGSFGVSVNRGTVKLSLVFLAYLADRHGPQAAERYRELIEASKSVDLPVRDMLGANR